MPQVCTYTMQTDLFNLNINVDNTTYAPMLLPKLLIIINFRRHQFGSAGFFLPKWDVNLCLWTVGYKKI